MSPLLLPLTPRFLALTLASLSTVGFAAALAFDRQSILLAICFSVASSGGNPGTRQTPIRSGR